MIASGDWRLFFLNYDQLKSVTPEDVVRVAKLYFKASNRTVGEFIPTAEPDRTEVPASADLTAVFKEYKSGMSISKGEAFDPSPANIEKHLTRAKLPNGLKMVMLPKNQPWWYRDCGDPDPVSAMRSRWRVKRPPRT